MLEPWTMNPGQLGIPDFMPFDSSFNITSEMDIGTEKYLLVFLNLIRKMPIETS